jgi:hypothetical protein
MGYMERILERSVDAKRAAQLATILSLLLIFGLALITYPTAASDSVGVFLMLLALVLAIRVYRHPRDSIVAGPMFLLAANVFLPSSARFDHTIPNPELHFYAAGILLITLAAVGGVGLRAACRLPVSLWAFCGAAIGASVFGYLHGNESSYVLRQLYGTLLFAAYFVLAQQCGDEETFLQKARKYGVPCALAFFIYYGWVFSEHRIHKEITTVGLQAGILSILFAARAGWRWKLASGIMSLVPLLLVWRHVIASFVLALVIILALGAKSRLRRWASWCVVAAIVLATLVPSCVQTILDTAMGSAAMDRVLPEGARDSTSIADRSVQLLEAGLIVRQSPVFGSGMGAVLEWQSVSRAGMAQAYVDNGWAYILTKMGLAGAVTFGWFLLEMIRRMRHASLGLSACLLSMVLITMFAVPVFLQFETSPFVGVVAGLLFANRPKPDPARPHAAAA